MGDRDPERPCLGCAAYWNCMERNRARCIYYHEKDEGEARGDKKAARAFAG